jgi:hypothetical protein
MRTALKVTNKLMTGPSVHQITFGGMTNLYQCSDKERADIASAIAEAMPGFFEIVKSRPSKDSILKMIKRPDSLGAASFSACRVDDKNLLMAELFLKLNRDRLGEEVCGLLESALLKASTKELSINVPIFNLRPRGYVNYRQIPGFLENLALFVEAIQGRKVCVVRHSRVASEEGKAILFAPVQILSSAEKLYINGFLGEMVRNNAASAKMRREKSGGSKPKKKFEECGERTLALQRVKSVEITSIDVGKNFLNTPRSSAETSQNKEDNIFGFMLTESFHLEVNFAPELRGFILETKWPGALLGPVVIKTGKYEGWVKLKLNCGDTYEAVKWLLSFGSKAAIITPDTPKSFRDAYRNELKKMAKLVGGLDVRETKTKKKEITPPPE